MDPLALRRLAWKWNVPLGIVEKDHAITVALGVLSGLPCMSLMTFKGGTALRKVYFGEHRFSEDIDFTVRFDVARDIKEAEEKFLAAGGESAVRFTSVERSAHGKDSRTVLIRYEDMNRHPNSIRVEMSLREKVLLRRERRAMIDPYGVAREASPLPVMALREILAEKVRALHMRSLPRDLFDLWTLIGKGVPVEAALVEAKLKWWKKGLSYEPGILMERIQRLEHMWERDLGPLLSDVPDFGRVARAVLRSIGPPKA